MKIRMQDGRVFEGTAIEIVQSMKSIAFGAPNMTLTEYIDWVAARARTLEGVAIEIAGANERDRCESLLREMLARGLIERG